jgi:hypothetical protein
LVHLEEIKGIVEEIPADFMAKEGGPILEWETGVPMLALSVSSRSSVKHSGTPDPTPASAWTAIRHKNFYHYFMDRFWLGTEDYESSIRDATRRIGYRIEKIGEIPLFDFDEFKPRFNNALYGPNYFLRKQEVLLMPKELSKEILVDHIDSFKEVHKIRPNRIKNFVPLDLSEEFVKKALASIIGEPFVPKDWGGELSDLFTTRVILNSRRIRTAFMFKGKGCRKKLTIADCGKNGDQILRLFKLPAELFIVQHVGEVDSMIHEFLEIVAESRARHVGKTIYYCVMDGVDTARVLLSHNIIN